MTQRDPTMPSISASCGMSAMAIAGWFLAKHRNTSEYETRKDLAALLRAHYEMGYQAAHRTEGSNGSAKRHCGGHHDHAERT